MAEGSYYSRETGLRSVLKMLLFKNARVKGGRKRGRRRRDKHIQQFKVY